MQTTTTVVGAFFSYCLLQKLIEKKKAKIESATTKVKSKVKFKHPVRASLIVSFASLVSSVIFESCKKDADVKRIKERYGVSAIENASTEELERILVEHGLLPGSQDSEVMQKQLHL